MAIVYQTATPSAHATTSCPATWILPTEKTPHARAKKKTAAGMSGCCDEVGWKFIDYKIVAH